MTRAFGFCIAVCLSVFPPTAWAQDFNRGLAAYEAADYETALKEFLPLAEDGDPRAQAKLGVMYFMGWGVRQDDLEYVRLTRLAVQQGDPSGQYNLALDYNEGRLVPKDHSEAVRLFRLSAEQGNAQAQWKVGSLYSFGLLGVSKDKREAVRWYRLAAHQGNDSGLQSLGSSYLSGEGVPQDYLLAYMWLNLAVASGFPTPEYRDKAAAKLPPEQLVEAQRMAQICLDSDYQDCGY